MAKSIDQLDREFTVVAYEQAAKNRRDAIDNATKIVAEFESIFGHLTATERRWLTRRIAGQEV